MSISPALLNNFLSKHKIEIEPSEMLRQLDEVYRLVGLSPIQLLQELFRRLGIRHVGLVQTALSQSAPGMFPALIFLEGRWGIIERIESQYVVSLEQEAARKFQSLEELPVTVIIWLNDTSSNYSAQSYNGSETVLSLIKSVVKKQPRWFFDLTVASIVINVFAIVSSLFAMQVYDRVVPTLAFDTLTTLVLGVTIVYLVDFCLKTARSSLLDYKASSIDKFLSRRVYDHLLNVQLDSLPAQLGTLTANISGVESVRQFLTSSVIFALVDLPFSLFFLVTIYIIGGPISFVYVVFFIISITIGFLAQKRSQSLIKQVAMRSNERQGLLVDTIRGAETIKSIGGRSEFQDEWNQISETVSSYGIRQKRIASIATNISSTLGSIAYVVAIVIGVYLIKDGNITMGTMIACSILGGRVLGPVSQAVSYLIQYEGVHQSAILVNKFLSLPTDRSAGEAVVFPLLAPSNITVSGLQFSYDNSKIMHVDIQGFEVKAGERIAILGSIGSGKSTFLKILAGLYRPRAGIVKLGGVDIWSLDPVYLNKNVSYLPQSPDLFKGTLKSNLTLGKYTNDTHLIQTINALGLNTIVDKSEKGLDAPINEGGGGLSGGQKQLVGLGRVFLNAPTVWLLDEPTASLDPDRQTGIRKALKDYVSRNDILIFATHNPNFAMEIANRIVVMEGGKIVKDVPSSSVQMRRANV